MSKRDTFKSNITAITRAKSFASAIKGWEIVHDISLIKPMAGTACELCGTHFWNGALIRRPATRSRKAITLTVGGTCLETILRGSFIDHAFIAERKKDVMSRLRKTYGSLIEDPGNWIKWIIEHVPTRLAPLAAQLRHLGMVPTDRDLNRLIVFHDATRKYPAGALLPILQSSVSAFSIPSHLTIKEARSILLRISPDKWDTIFSQLSTDFRVEEIDEFLSKDAEWNEASNRLTSTELRAFIALAKLSSHFGSSAHSNLNALVRKLPPIPNTHIVPFFVWDERLGLAIIGELSDEFDDEATAWYWCDNKYHKVHLGNCKCVAGLAEDVVLELEAIAYWVQPPWYTGRIMPHGHKSSKSKRIPKEKRNTSKQSTSEDMALVQIPCITNMLEIARFKNITTLADQLKWLKNRLRGMGHRWSEFKWKAERYSTNPDCRYQIDNITKKLSMQLK